MKITRLLPLTIAITAILLTTACKKDSLPDAEGTRLTKIAYRSNSDSSTVLTFSYYDNGKMKSTTVTHNNIPFGRIGYLYDASGKLETTEHTNLNSGYVFTYSYIHDGNKIVKKESHAAGFQFSHQYIYNAQGLLIADSVSGAGSTSYIGFVYTGDNLTQWAYYYQNSPSTWQSGENFKATYTNVDNPFYEMGLLCYITGAMDLELGTIGFSRQLLSGIEHPNGLVIHYDYNFYSNGLPRVINVHSPAGIIYTGTIEFYYE